MSVFKCKMCGGTIEFEPGATVGVCDSCGTKQTLPRLDDDRRTNLYDRANHFRRNNEFDKAAGIYEQILTEDTTDAEAYWSLVLCRYGIEYVEDPATHKRVPTVNRAQFTSIFDDDNYKSALQYADAYQRSIYEEEANTINEIQKGILAISQREDPFDVFICYKETDNNGRRTQDSVLATDLYHQLTQEGFKVFFSRITLEDKLGTAYEPYIFAALNSAKVMVVLGTKPEHFNAVWVKNEWSRYLSLVKQSGGKKVLIPAYRDMDPYDLPEEFSHLQAQDMSKLGFMQDLIRGIKKIATADETKVPIRENVINEGGNTNVAPLLKRAFIFLEDGNWEDANAYCEKVLDQDPENAQAYLGKLMVELHVHSQDELLNCDEPFDENNNFRKAVRFGDDALVSTLNDYVSQIKERNENARLTGIYNSAVSAMHKANSEAEYKAVAEKLKTIPGFHNADSLVEQCLDNAEVARKETIYKSGRHRMTLNTINSYKDAIVFFQSISDWRDSEEQINVCQEKIEEIKAKEEANRLVREREEQERRFAAEKAARKRKTMAIVMRITILIFICLAVIYMYNTKQVSLKAKYDKALELFNEGKIVEAYERFISLKSYKDSEEKAAAIYDEYEMMIRLRKAEVGEYVLFGSYEQDNNLSNENEDIEWLVLAKEDDQILVISRYAIDCQKYSNSASAANRKWTNSFIRSWLNDSFVYTAFNEGERDLIRELNGTYDKVFLLSFQEVSEYMKSEAYRKCEATAYARAKGASDYWCLRASEINKVLNIGYVDFDGKVYEGGGSADFDYAVRPAMWIKID